MSDTMLIYVASTIWFHIRFLDIIIFIAFIFNIVYN